MAKTTSKALQFESYNTVEFFINKMNEYVSSGIIAHYFAMEHYGEDGGKDHIHCVCFPNLCSIDIKSFAASFREIGVTDCLCIDPSNYTCKSFYDALRYFQHDSMYLEYKGLVKEYRDYDFTRFITDDMEWFSNFYVMNNRTKMEKDIHMVMKYGFNGACMVSKSSMQMLSLLKVAAIIESDSQLTEVRKLFESNL